MDVSDHTLKWLHAGAAVCHLIQAGYGEALVNTIYKKDGQFPIANPVINNTNNLGQYQLTQLVPVFSLLSAVNHSWSFFDFERYKSFVDSGYNPVRWAEFSISASLMNYLIGSLSGIVDIKTLSGLVFANASLQYIGFSLEKDTGRAINTANTEISSLLYESAKRQEIGGFLIFFGYMAVIWTAFFTSVSESDQNVPSFVWLIIFIITALYITFGLLSICYVRGANRNLSGTGFRKFRETNFRKVEVGYIILSLVAKTFLMNMVLFGSVRTTPK